MTNIEAINIVAGLDKCQRFIVKKRRCKSKFILKAINCIKNTSQKFNLKTANCIEQNTNCMEYMSKILLRS